jgi:hypothetical protein
MAWRCEIPSCIRKDRLPGTDSIVFPQHPPIINTAYVFITRIVLNDRLRENDAKGEMFGSRIPKGGIPRAVTDDVLAFIGASPGHGAHSNARLFPSG